MDDRLKKLKRHVFYELLDIVGRAFVLVRPSENVVLGKRPLTPEEKENGIVLVFNSGMNFQWDDYGITATLVFGNSPQKCVIPADQIEAVYSPEANAQFIVLPSGAAKPGVKSMGQVKTEASSAIAGKVIKVDFTKKQKT
ncbi:MAG: hypothetical protein HQL08_03430 [Nitrospirae bacterium]|nr:hypothetical protein [Nitrospirota bacterium]